ncbi:hypothetical protein JTE90_020910 [Oedothorax gibbosus]|uniref:Uncharacterized protein n=1 Tax=Oedothorax gibbosus TaxID=931172 RepID=A0AAV6VPP2_9ARAC|nr:hypothetical protein JTE90_020910 [Oedothorax gibbosus]
MTPNITLSQTHSHLSTASRLGETIRNVATLSFPGIYPISGVSRAFSRQSHFPGKTGKKKITGEMHEEKRKPLNQSPTPPRRK